MCSFHCRLCRNEVLPQDTTHLIQRPCYQRGNPCQDPAGNWTTRRPPDHRKETQTAVVWSCLPFITFGQNHLARHSELKGGKRQSRQRKSREDNIRKWTGLEFGKSQRAVENSEKWRKLVAKSSVVTQRPLQLRDWQWWWWWWYTFTLLIMRNINRNQIKSTEFSYAPEACRETMSKTETTAKVSD